jgi:hypothetical protein
LVDGEDNKYCGTTVSISTENEMERRDCCASEGRRTSFGDCDDKRQGHGPAYDAILSFARNEKVWLSNFREAWMIATSNGFDNLTPINSTYNLVKVVDDFKTDKEQ